MNNPRQWWRTEQSPVHIRRGRRGLVDAVGHAFKFLFGTATDDEVEDIKQNYAVDPARIHVTGLSSGGGMAVAMMVAHADKIASGAAVAGLPYAEKPDAVVHAFNHEPRNRPVVVLGGRGFIGARTSAFLHRKVQRVSVTQSLIQKRRGLATIRFFLASGSLRVPYVDYDLAKKIRDFVLYRVESSTLAWH